MKYKISQNKLNPHFLVRHPMLQTILASKLKPLTTGFNIANLSCKKVIISVDGAKLVMFQTPPSGTDNLGYVILIHGWEGSSDSNYIVNSANYFYAKGYGVFRLNLRDHGPSHGLNSGIFYGTLIQETFEAIAQIAASVSPKPVFLMGFSLGGNFSLRIGLKCDEKPIKNLSHILAVSPVLNPAKTTRQIDNNLFIKKYFLKKWRRSLAKKEFYFPQTYDFSFLENSHSLWEMTDVLIKKIGAFDSAKDYFAAYTLLNQSLSSIVPATTILTAEDDPIIDVGDFFNLQLPDHVQLSVQKYGGHNGFFHGYPLKLFPWFLDQAHHVFRGASL